MCTTFTIPRFAVGTLTVVSHSLIRWSSLSFVASSWLSRPCRLWEFTRNRTLSMSSLAKLVINMIFLLRQALKRTLSFNKFIKGYQTLLYRIQKRYGIKEPTTVLEFNELMEYVDRLNSKYDQRVKPPLTMTVFSEV